MNTNKLFLLITNLAFGLWMLAGCGSAPAAPTVSPSAAPASAATLAAAPAAAPTQAPAPSDFSGKWEDSQLGFSLDLTQKGDQLQGSHSIVAQQGNKIDSLDSSIAGTVTGSVAVISFKSSFTTNSGTAELSYVDASSLKWKVTKAPDGENYFPPEATLLRAPAASAANPVPATRIQFQPNSVSWQTPGDLAPNASIRFVLGAQKGQPMTVELTTDPDPGPGFSAVLSITGADGQTLTSEPTTRWKGVLTVSQDYFIEVRSVSAQSLNYSLLVAIPALGSTPYVPVPDSICQALLEMAAQAIPVSFTLEANVPFIDPVTGEQGLGCSLTAQGIGGKFPAPSQAVASLVSAFQGFSEQIAYQADGPTGSATAVSRDMALVLIRSEWTPAAGVTCPADQPISACNLTQEQKSFVIQIQAAMK